ncbi:MAG: histidine kinase [Prevotellaceae bacterium]|jgi:sensor histidine kinase YesM|nr:histidine kinase [Prevotellaceae bacterium]
MNLLGKYHAVKSAVISLVSALIIVYPNIACLPWDLSFLDGGARSMHLWHFGFRYLFFVLFIAVLVHTNLRTNSAASFPRRLLYNLLTGAVAYTVYVAISLLAFRRGDCFGSLLLFQFVMICLLSTFAGHISLLYTERRVRQQEIEQLKIENLQSRYDALTNQINPHFLFNSLSGLTALIRKGNEENTLEYVNKMSDLFRYILQSDRKGLVTLEEELEFVHSFRYMMEVRFANKLQFRIDVPEEKRRCELPVLSLLPLIDNVMMHNIIDSRHKMVISITLNPQNELVVSTPRYPKLIPAATNGTGLRNLENRFVLLMNRHIRIEEEEGRFTVYLALKQ